MGVCTSTMDDEQDYPPEDIVSPRHRKSIEAVAKQFNKPEVASLRVNKVNTGANRLWRVLIAETLVDQIMILQASYDAADQNHVGSIDVALVRELLRTAMTPVSPRLNSGATPDAESTPASDAHFEEVLAAYTSERGTICKEDFFSLSAAMRMDCLGQIYSLETHALLQLRDLRELFEGSPLTTESLTEMLTPMSTNSTRKKLVAQVLESACEGCSFDQFAGVVARCKCPDQPQIVEEVERAVEEIEFASYTMQACLQNERQLLEWVGPKRQEVWKRINRANGVEVWELKQALPTGANVAVLGRVLIAAPVEVVLAAIQSPELLKDTTVEKVSELEWGDTGSPRGHGEPHRSPMSIEWVGVKLPVVSKRDFCTCTHKAEFPDGSVILSAMSLHVPQNLPFASRVAPRANHERGRVLTGGWHVCAAPNTPGATVGTWVNVSNSGGHLPQMLLNMGWSKSKAVDKVAAVKVLAEQMAANSG